MLISKKELSNKILTNQINYGGNKKLKIFGKLNCKSGKRMKKENRVFFETIEEAKKLEYRPCGHCMKVEYSKWKKNN